MKVEYALRLRDEVKSALRDCFSTARHFGSSSEAMETNRRNVFNRLPKDAPEWIRQYADGYWRALVDSAYERDLVYGGFVGETFYSVHSDRADYYEKHGIAPSAYAENGAVTNRGHYWKESVSYRNAVQPFFVG